MAEAFVKTFKRDYAHLAKLDNASSVIAEIRGWVADYNDHHPHSGLGMRLPQQFRASNHATQFRRGLSGLTEAIPL